MVLQTSLLRLQGVMGQGRSAVTPLALQSTGLSWQRAVFARRFSAAATNIASAAQLPAATSLPSSLAQGDSSRTELTTRSGLSGGGVYPPVHGGPLYWSLRRGWTSLKRTVRRSNRAWDFNWELGRTTFAGVPKFSYNPKANEWIYLIDNEEWNGVGGRVWITISMQILFFFHWAFWFYFLYYRILVNGKLDAFGKWKDRAAEARAA